MLPTQLSFLRSIRNTGSPIPESVPHHISENHHYKRLLFLMEDMSALFTFQFPTIIAPMDTLGALVVLSQLFSSDIVRPMNEARDKREIVDFGRKFYGSTSVQGLRYIARMGARYIASSDASIRRALVSHWVPVFHALTRVSRSLSLPDIFIHDANVEFLTEVMKFDPLYEQNDFNKAWMLSMEQQDNNHALVLPLLPPVDIDDFPLVVTEFLNIDNSSPITDTMDSIIQQLVAAINMSSTHMKIHVVRSALFYMFQFPGITDVHRSYFCTQSQFLWSDLLGTLMTLTEVLTSTNVITLIDLFRVCGKSYLSIDDRVRLVLPIVLAGSRDISTIHEVCVADHNGNTNFLTNITMRLFARIPIPHWREQILLKRNESAVATKIEHGKLLGQFLSEMLKKVYPSLVSKHNTVSAVRKRVWPRLTLAVLGKITALLVVAGDPDRLLQTLLSNGTMPNLYMKSIFVRNGFCQVLDCNVFDTMFDDDELPAVLEILRQERNVY